jgi:hypothetical protein
MSSYTDAEIEGLLRQTRGILNRGWYEIREQTKTDNDERRRRTEELCAETQRILERDRTRREQRRMENRAREEEAEAYLLADLKSSSEGERLGRQFGHDPYRLAQHLGVAIQDVDLAELQNPRRPSIEIWGRLLNFAGSPIVQLADMLRGRDRLWVLAHELGHFLNFPDDRLCNQFADSFMKVADDETPAGRWGQWQRQGSERLREQARRQARRRAGAV